MSRATNGSIRARERKPDDESSDMYGLFLSTVTAYIVHDI